MLGRVFPLKVSALLSLFIILAISILWGSQAYAQVSGATLTGTVKDASGAVIPNAQVSITAVATGVIRTVSTGGAGLYTAPNLLPGNYEVRATAQGFSSQLQKGITLTVGAQQQLDITMQVGQVTQTVQVNTEAPTVELTSSTLSATVNATTVRELPLNGRSWTDLANLQPGVVSAQTHVSVAVERGFGAQLSISGSRPQQNNYRLDGISINDYSNGGPGSVLGQNLGVEAIEEFSVLTSNYSAEYGKTSGGVVNAISRSGTNSFHGSAYEFLRNSALDTRNFFDGPTVPPFRRNQFGASAGGPIRKDRTFIFGDYEGIRQSLGTTQIDTVVSEAARGIGTGPNGGRGPSTLCSNPSGADPSSPCSTQTLSDFVASQKQLTNPNADPTTGIDKAVLKYLPFFALPNAGVVGNGDLGRYQFVLQQVINENYFTARVDQKISEKDSLFGTYVYDYSPLTQPDILNNVLLQSIAKRQIAAFEESHIFSPTFINSFRVGYNRDRAYDSAPVKAINPVAADASQGWAPGFNPPRIVGAGLTTNPGLAPASAIYVWNAYQVYDDAFLTRGLHSLKFGVGVERDQLNETTTGADYLGTFRFGALTNLLTNNPGSVVGAVPGLITPRYMRISIVGAYVQDDWRFRPSLTLNLGLRWEMATVPTETEGKLTNLPTLEAAVPHLGDPYFSNPTLRNFEPRVGFAWDPFGNGKTAARGGFGMFDVLPMLYTTVTLNGRGAPFYELEGSNSLGQGTFPGGALSSIIPGNGLSYVYVEHHPHRNYVMQWNLNVQRQLAPSLTAVVGYVGSHGVHQAFRADDANLVLPTLTSAGYLWPVVQDPKSGSLGPGTLINTNPNVGQVRFLNWPGNSSYNSLQIGVLKKMSQGLQIQGSFTWGKSTDNNSGVIAGDTFANGIGSLPWFDMKLNHGLSDYNIGRVLVINGSWQLPTSKSAPAFVGWAVNGWEFGGILKVSDGPPFTPTFGTAGGDPQLLGSTDPWAFPNRLTTPACKSLVNPGNPNNYVKTECFAVPTAPTSFFTGPTPLCSSDPRFGGNAIGNASLLQCFNLRGNAGRNTIPGAGLMNLDLSLFKNNYIKKISENFNVQFRTEIFNILNHANFGTPVEPDNTDIFDATGSPNPTAGLLTSTTTPSRQLQFAVKVIW